MSDSIGEIVVTSTIIILIIIFGVLIYMINKGKRLYRKNNNKYIDEYHKRIERPEE